MWKFLQLLAIALLVQLGFAQPATAQAGKTLPIHLDRQVVYESESFRILIRTDGNRANQPDTTPLENDFYVFGSSFQSQTSFVNGRRTQSAEWVITLQPKKVGELSIPSISVGSAKTDAGKVTVLPVDTTNDAPGSPGSPVVVEVTVDNENPYVQSKVIVIAKVWLDETMLGGSLTDPDLEGAIMERMGTDLSYSAKRNGKTFQVIQRDFALFPQASGTVTIPPLIFDGNRQASRSSTGNSPFSNDPFFGNSGFTIGRGSPIRAQSEAIELEIRPKPEEAKGKWWLPARKIELLEAWEPQPPVFRVGEPVTRTLALRATGLADSQMPTLEVPKVAGCKSYPGTPGNRTSTVDGEVVSIAVQPIVMVPTQSGELELPAIEIPWWDIATDSMQVARIEARTIQVLEAENSVLGAVTAPRMQDPDPIPVEENNVDPLADPEAPAEEIAASKMPWYLGGGLGGLLLIGLWARAKKRRRTGDGSKPSAPRISKKAAEKSLRIACTQSDPAAVCEKIIELGKSLWPNKPPLNATDFASRMSSTKLKAEAAALEALRFAPQSKGNEPWNGIDLWQAYCEAQVVTETRTDSNPLQALYPKQS